MHSEMTVSKPVHEELFHPLVAEWFGATFSGPTAVQERGWRSISAGQDTLLAAPTGSGKTLAAFACEIDKLVRASFAGRLEDRTYVIYVSPLKALGNDIAKPTSIAAKPLVGADPEFVTTVGLGNLKVTTAQGLKNDGKTDV